MEFLRNFLEKRALFGLVAFNGLVSGLQMYPHFPKKKSNQTFECMVFAITFWKCKTKKRRFSGIIYVKKKSYSHGANRYRIPNAKFGLLGVFGVDPKAFIVHFSQDFWKVPIPDPN